ncbi:transposase domain-containing protein [Streptomyces sp. NPDC054949]
MPRPGQSRAADDGLSDRIAIGLLMHTFPPDMVDHAVAECGRVERRSRLLPARTVVYFVLAICLFAQHRYEQVARILAEGMAWVGQDGCPCPVPTSAAISRARARLGPEPLAALFAETACPARAPQTGRERCARYRQWRVLTVDATAVCVPDSPDNRAWYGCPPGTAGCVGAAGSMGSPGTAGPAGVPKTPSSPDAPVPRPPLPHVHVAALAECGSHTITRAALGQPSSGVAHTLTGGLFATLTPGDLLLAECGSAALELLPAARAAGADVLWRTGPGHVPALTVDAALPDGSYLCDLRCGLAGARLRVRVIDDLPHRLITTLLDHETDPSPGLLALHRRRRGIRASLEAIGTLRHGTAPVLRSRWPGGVEQEVWGHLLVHHSIRPLLFPA